MADYGLKRNGSGYKDETAYKAFMSMAKSGEVWTANDGRERVLILKNQGSFCNCLTLTDDDKHEGNMEIISAGTMYTNPGMVKYLFNHRLGAFVQKLPATEFDAVVQAVEDALSIGRKKVDKDHRRECHELLDKILDRVGAQ